MSFLTNRFECVNPILMLYNQKVKYILMVFRHNLVMGLKITQPLELEHRLVIHFACCMEPPQILRYRRAIVFIKVSDIAQLSYVVRRMIGNLRVTYFFLSHYFLTKKSLLLSNKLKNACIFGSSYLCLIDKGLLSRS